MNSNVVGFLSTSETEEDQHCHPVTTPLMLGKRGLREGRGGSGREAGEGEEEGQRGEGSQTL